MNILIVHPAHKDNFHLDILNQGYCEFIEKLCADRTHKVDIRNLDAEFHGTLEDPKGMSSRRFEYNFLEDRKNLDVLLDYLNGYENQHLTDFLDKILLGKAKGYDCIIFAINWHRQILGGLVLAKYLKADSNQIFFGNIIRHSSYRAVNLEMIRNKYDFIDYLIEEGRQEDVLERVGLKGCPEYPGRYNLLLSRKYRFVCYELEAGCLGKCMFCSNAKTAVMNEDHFQRRLSRLKDISKINNRILFMQPAINPTKRYVKAFIDYVKANKISISWTSYAMCKNLDYETLRELSGIGCKLLEFGVESGSQKIVNYLQKGSKVEETARILRDCRRAGIETCIFIMVAVPYETDEDFKETIQFIRDNQDDINHLDYDCFQVRYGSEMYLHPERFGLRFYKAISDNVLTLTNNQEVPYDEVDGITWKETLVRRRRRMAVMRWVTKNFKGKVYTTGINRDCPGDSGIFVWEDLFENKYLRCLEGV